MPTWASPSKARLPRGRRTSGEGAAIYRNFDVFNQASRHYVDVFNRGGTPISSFSATTSAPWIKLSATSVTVDKEQRLWVSIDWNQAPADSADGSIQITALGTNTVTVKVNTFNPAQPERDAVNGFVEAGGMVSIEAEHFTRAKRRSPMREKRSLGKSAQLRTHPVLDDHLPGHRRQRDAAREFAASGIQNVSVQHRPGRGHVHHRAHAQF